MCSDHCVRLSAALQVCFVVEKCLMMFVSVPSQCSIRCSYLCVRHFCWSCHVFIYTTTNKTQHMTVSPDSPQHSWNNSLFSVLYILNIHRLKAEVESERYVSLKMHGGISACCLPLIQSFKWHEKQQRSLRGVTSVCLWRKKHLQTYPAFLQWQERKRKQRLGGHVSMEEHQPSAAAKARQTMTLKPFCVSKTRKVLHRLESKSFPFFFFFLLVSHENVCCSLWTLRPYRLTYLYFYWQESNTTALSAQITGGASTLWINGKRISEMDSTEQSCPTLQEEGQIRLEQTLSSPATVRLTLPGPVLPYHSWSPR